MNAEDTMTWAIEQIKKLGLTVTDELGQDIANQKPAHPPSDAFPYRIRENPLCFLGMISDRNIILFPRGYTVIPQDILVQWMLAGILRRHVAERFSVTPVDDSEF